jgi:aminoglycoside phosphotransferase (APT) family kinase protein
VPAVRPEDEYVRALELATPFLGVATRRWLDQRITALIHNPSPRTLVHRDFRLEHLYIDAQHNLVGVIDFGDATIDDTALDFAKLDGEVSDAFLAEILQSYRGPEGDHTSGRIRTYREIHPLFEVADPDGWGDRPSALRRLAAQAAATSRHTTRLTRP